MEYDGHAGPVMRERDGALRNCVAWVVFTNVCSGSRSTSEAIGARPELSIRVVSTSVS